MVAKKQEGHNSFNYVNCNKNSKLLHQYVTSDQLSEYILNSKSQTYDLLPIYLARGIMPWIHQKWVFKWWISTNFVSLS